MKKKNYLVKFYANGKLAGQIVIRETSKCKAWEYLAKFLSDEEIELEEVKKIPKNVDVFE